MTPVVVDASVGLPGVMAGVLARRQGRVFRCRVTVRWRDGGWSRHEIEPCGCCTMTIGISGQALIIATAGSS